MQGKGTLGKQGVYKEHQKASERKKTTNHNPKQRKHPMHLRNRGSQMT